MSRRSSVPFLLLLMAMPLPAAAQNSDDAILFNPKADIPEEFRTPGNAAPPTTRFGRAPVYRTTPSWGAGATGFISTNRAAARNAKAGRRTSATSAAGARASTLPPPAPQPAFQPLPLPRAAPLPVLNPGDTPLRVPPAASQRVQRQGILPPPTAPGLVPPGFAPPPLRRIPVDPAPFDALGWRAGAFLVKPAVELTAGYDSNASRSNTPRASSIYTVSPEMLLRSDWQRHALNADLRGSYATFGDQSSLNRPTFDGKVDARIDVRRNIIADLQARALVGTDNPGSPNIQVGLSRLPIFTTFGGAAGLTYRWNRLELTGKGSADTISYEQSRFADGTTSSNKDRDYQQYAGALRLSYETTPGFKPFVEASLDTRKHDVAVDRNGERRDSKGVTYRAGARFDFTQRLVGEASAGYTDRTYDDPTLPDLKGFIFDASLVWTPNALTTATLTAKSAANELTQPGVSGYLSRDVGIQVDHAFRQWLVGTMRVNLGFDAYDCYCRNDQRYLIGAGFAYKVTRTLHVKGEVRREWLTSSTPSQDYKANVVTLGVRLQR